MENQRVILWTAPRCVSTAFERSILEIQGIKILHEPFSRPYYFGPECQSERYAISERDSDSTYSNVLERFRQTFENHNVVFSKDMAYYLEGRLEELLDPIFEGTKHTFLIRHPKKAIPSLYKASVDKARTGWDHFNPKEAGFHSLVNLYEFIRATQGCNPLVVDADDLLENPNFIMGKYCQGLGLPYDEQMLTWKAGTVTEWNEWSGWHDDAINSTGFARNCPDARGKESSKRSREAEYILMPDIVKKTVEESMSAYNALYTHRIVLPEN